MGRTITMHDSPNMSDQNLLLTVEDLINISMGPENENRINFKVLQTVLHILARQLRMLERKVEIRGPDRSVKKKPKKTKTKGKKSDKSDQSDSDGKRDRKKDGDDVRKGESSVERGKGGRAKGKRGDEEGGRRQGEDQSSDEESDGGRGNKRGKGEKGKGRKRSPESEDDLGRRRRRGYDSDESDDEDDDGRRTGDEGRKGKGKRGRSAKRGGGGSDDELSGAKSRTGRSLDDDDRGGRKSKKSLADKDKRGRGGRGGSDISVTERGRDKDKVLVVEKGKGKGARGGPSDTRSLRVGSVEVVPRSEFEKLQQAVRGLQGITGPIPSAFLPDNERLRADIAKGNASLTDAMKTMQVTARVGAAEEAIQRLAGLLTALAASGALPPDLTQKIQQAQQYLQTGAGVGGPGGARMGGVGFGPGGIGAGGMGPGGMGAGGMGPGGIGPGRMGVGGMGPGGMGVGGMGPGGMGVGGMAPGGMGPGGMGVGGMGPGGMGVGAMGPGGMGAGGMGAGGMGPGGMGPGSMGAGGMGPGEMGAGGFGVGGPGGLGVGGAAGAGGFGVGGPGGVGMGGAARGMGPGGVVGGPGGPGGYGPRGFGGLGGAGGFGPGDAGPGGFGPDGLPFGAGMVGMAGAGPGGFGMGGYGFPGAGGPGTDLMGGFGGGGMGFQFANKDCVTQEELGMILSRYRDELMKMMNALIGRANAQAETAMQSARTLAEQFDAMMNVTSRVKELEIIVHEYSEQLDGFNEGFTTQLSSVDEQMVQLLTDLKSGLVQMEQANSNTETAAVMELTERYEALMQELDNAVSANGALLAYQQTLEDELRRTLEIVELLREQKSDRDELLDGLRDKADSARLAGLLTEAEFALVRRNLEKRIDICHDKFEKQDYVWQNAMKDLSEETDTKAELLQLMSTREEMLVQLQELHAKLQDLAVIVGEPHAAMLTRKLSKDGTCGVCLVPALMDAVDKRHGKPPALPAYRTPPAGAGDEECHPEWLPRPLETREHMCQRWVGGSHTLLTKDVHRQQAEFHIAPVPRVTAQGLGTDGRLYMMEEELVPCKECNVEAVESVPVVPVEPTM